MIKICERHPNQVPLLWTFKFRGSEYWCPFCGYTCGMFGEGGDVPETDELSKAYEEWSIKAEAFLSGETEEWIYEGKVAYETTGP